MCPPNGIAIRGCALHGYYSSLEGNGGGRGGARVDDAET
jgi:hypothetical protein